MTKEQENLVMSNYNLIYFVANKFKKLGYRIDEDYIHEGVLGLCRAATKYDKSKGKFTTYATTYIEYFMKDYYLRNKKDDCCLSLQIPLSKDEDSEKMIGDYLIDPVDRIAIHECQMDLDSEILKIKKYISPSDFEFMISGNLKTTWERKRFNKLSTKIRILSKRGK